MKLAARIGVGETIVAMILWENVSTIYPHVFRERGPITDCMMYGFILFPMKV